MLFRRFSQKRGGVVLTFYERFKFLCEEKGVSPAQAARENGVTQQAASHWKTRGSMPKSETLWKFVSYFDTNIDFLLGKEGAAVRYSFIPFGSDISDAPIEQQLLELGGIKALAEFHFLSQEDKREALKDINNFVEFTLNKYKQEEAVERAKELTEIPRYRLQDPPESPPAPAGDTDTPTAQDAPEGPEKGK